MTDPYYVPGRDLNISDALSLYSLATTLDSFPGQYPPTDRGTSGLAVAKAAVQRRYIAGYSHAFGLEHALGTLVLGPVITGIPWYFSFDTPRQDGECRIEDMEVRGAHEVELFGIDVANKRVWAYNSLGPTWGALRDGTFYWSFETYEQLLAEQGDVTAFTVTH